MSPRNSIIASKGIVKPKKSSFLDSTLLFSNNTWGPGQPSHINNNPMSLPLSLPPTPTRIASAGTLKRPSSHGSNNTASQPPNCPSPQQSAANLFTCTFCWHLSADAPHVLGRAARLACGPCHAALIALAIC